MTQITIGRFGGSGSFDVDAHTFDLSGANANVQGYIENTDRTLIALARQQLNGLSEEESDERVVPVTFASDSSLDGFYEVNSAAVEMDVGRYAAKSLPWSAQLTRVPNFRRPDIYLRSFGDVRDNVDSYTTVNTSPTVAFPGDVSAMTLPTTSPTSMDTAFGLVAVSTHADFYNAISGYKVGASDFYDGACRVEQKIGSTWYPIVGRQHHAAATDLRVNNGLLRIAGVDNTTSSGLSFESFVSGSTWGPTKTVNFRRSGATLVPSGPESVQVLRNTPEAVVIRFVFPANTGSVRTWLTVDVRLKRGHRVADVTMTAPYAVNWQLRFADAMSSTTGGYQASANDANSQRHVVFVRTATTLTGSNLDVQYTGTSTGPVVFGLGVRETGGASLWGTIGDTSARWFADVDDTQIISL